MAEQKAQARAAWAGSGEEKDAAIWFDLAEECGTNEFLGYETESAEAQIVAIVSDGKKVTTIDEGQAAWLVVNQTPFYAESGGQVADHGFVRALADHSTHGVVSDVQRFAGGKIIGHYVIAKSGKLTVGDAVAMEVDHPRRTTIRANHSATHLLHEALRRALGDHVAQRGSLNAEDRLRFDFSHAKAVSPAEMDQVEVEVNSYIRQNTLVETRIMTPDDARAIGAQALFGEKYGDEVRVVSMGKLSGSGKGAGGETYSIELCGGTHVRRTGDIGGFVLLGDSASSAGVRRIEALTGEAARKHLAQNTQHVSDLATALKVQPEALGERVKALLDERKALQNEVGQLRRDLAMSGGAGEGPEAQEVNGIPFFAQVLSGVSGKDLPPLIDDHKSRLGSGAILLIADAGGKAALAAGVTADLTDKLSAVDLVKAAAQALGGKGGGGRPDLAQAGGPSAENSGAAIKAAQAILEG